MGSATDRALTDTPADGLKGHARVPENGGDQVEPLRRKEEGMGRGARHWVVAILAAVALGASTMVVAQGCGEVWEAVLPPEHTEELYAGIWAKNQFVVGGNGVILTSPDGLTWTQDAVDTFCRVTGIAYGAGRYVAAVATDRAILISRDGHRWRKHVVEDGGWFNDVLYAEGLFVAVGLHGHVWTSPDGLSWTKHHAGYKKGWLTSIAYGGGRFVAVGPGGVFLTSPDGVNWHRRTPKPGMIIPYGLGPRIAYGPAGFVVVDQETIWTSPDGRSWTRRNTSEYYNLQSVTYAGGAYVAVGEKILTSPDGVTWSPQNAPAISILYGVVTSGSTVLAFGSGYDGLHAAILLSRCEP